NQLLFDHFAQLEAVQREDAHHLDEAGRQNLLLRHFEIEFEPLPGHGWSRLFSLLSLIQAKMIAEINSPDLRIIAQFLRAALTEYFPTFQDVCAIGDAESFPDVMIGNQHANSQIREVPDDPLTFLECY